MLYVSLTLSVLLLVIANVGILRSSNGWLNAFGFIGLFFSFGTICAGFFLPPVALLFLVLAALVGIWVTCKLRPWVFLPVSCVAAAVVAGIIGQSVLHSQSRYAGLRAQYPYESMEDRLPPAKATYRLEVIPEAIAESLASAEDSLEGRSRTMRSYFLEQVHEQTTALFVNSSGFGVARMGRPTEQSLAGDPERNKSIPQPEPRLSSSAFLDDVEWTLRLADKSLTELHRSGALDFVNPVGFGFVKDRRKVAGFQSHQLSRVPGPAKPWVVRNIDLVGLVVNPKPVVYVSEHLPRMDELRKAPVRLLDSFESAGLEKLRRGEELVFGTNADRGRMLGAIRSVKQCVQCHDGERGDLLGAFSYRLQSSDR
jgi:hypothetical protein